MTSPLSYFVVLDLESGTFFGADNAYIVDTRKIPDLETFNEGNDSDRREIAEQHGVDLELYAQALDAIAALLSSEDWSSDHLSAVADIVRSTGRTIEDIAA